MIHRESSSEESDVADKFPVVGKNMYLSLGDSSSIPGFHLMISQVLNI
jgi:hypothetical protein